MHFNRGQTENDGKSNIAVFLIGGIRASFTSMQDLCLYDISVAVIDLPLCIHLLSCFMVLLVKLVYLC